MGYCVQAKQRSVLYRPRITLEELLQTLQDNCWMSYHWAQSEGSLHCESGVPLPVSQRWCALQSHGWNLNAMQPGMASFSEKSRVWILILFVRTWSILCIFKHNYQTMVLWWCRGRLLGLQKLIICDGYLLTISFMQQAQYVPPISQGHRLSGPNLKQTGSTTSVYC